ncbi:hypothetical protein BGX24_012055 [Mortierella sp. AD032]|nr:hypothetical protein BGX24_012055 [Mortierella sp. AD032]
MISPTTSCVDLSRISDDKSFLRHGQLNSNNNSNNTLASNGSGNALAGDDNKIKEYTTIDDVGVDIEIASYNSSILNAREDTTETELVDGPLYGWVVVFACFMYQMVTMGLCNSYGVFQNFYLTETFKDKATVFQITWIGTLAMTVLDALGPFTGSICDHFGHRTTTLIGASVMTLSLVLAAFSTQVWQLYLTQGLLYGAGTSLTYFASMTLPSQWFTKNRGLVTGIAISGGGIGGLWISPIVSKLLNNKGFKFTMLVIAAVHLVILIPAGLLHRSRRETGRQRAMRIKHFGCCEGESVETDRARKSFVDFTILKDFRFCLLVVSCAFVIGGYFSPFFFITSYAIQHGVNESTAALMVGLMNGSAAVGRIVMGFVLDRIGSINALCISTFATTLTLFFLWMFAKTPAMMIIFSIAYGLCGGAHVSSAISASSAIAGLDRLGSVTGIMYAVMTIGSTIGSPISGVILDTIGHHSDYTGVIVWAGSVMLIASLIQFVLRFVTSRSLFVKV